MEQLTEVPTEVLATPMMLHGVLMEGGHATVTVRNPETGRHVTVKLAVRLRRDGGGFVPRNTIAGRVGFADGTLIEARDPDLDYDHPACYIGRFYKDTGEWRSGRTADPTRAWTAEKIIAMALSPKTVRFDNAEVYLATQCRECARQLRHPESVAELIGPECSGRRRVGRAAARTQVTA